MSVIVLLSVASVLAVFSILWRLLLGRYHYEQILKRYEQSKPTFTDSTKNIASLTGENRSVILFMTPSRL